MVAERRGGWSRRIGLALGVTLLLVSACGTSGVSPLEATSAAGSPTITGLVPSAGRAAGGTYVLLTGSGFVEGETRVLFGAEESYGVTWVSETQLKVLAPPGPLGTSVDLVVEVGEEEGALRGVKRGAFAYDGVGRGVTALLGLFIIALALLGLPLFLVIGAATALGYYVGAMEAGLGFFKGLSYMGQEKAGLGATIFNWVTDMGGKPLFIAIPLFTFAGGMMSESGAPTRLVNVARALVGWFPGGLAWVTLLVCCFFTAFTGASGVTIIALGGLLFPILLDEGYGENYSLGLLTTGGSLGLLIPPSLPVIVYGIIAGLDADRIWDAGIGPMILIVVLLGGHAIIVARGAGVPQHKTSLKEILSALRAAAFELPLPFVVVFGIKGGFVTATEAAAVTAVWVLVAEVLIYRDISLRQLPGVIRRSMILVGGLIAIIGLALAFTTWLTKNEVPQRILAVMQSQIDSQLTFLLMLNLFLLIVGCLMDIFSAILVVVPLIAPVAAGFGVDPFHLSIIFLVNLEIGYSTPPVGINLFISSLRFKRPVFQMYRASLPFIAVLLVGLAVITYMPGLTLGRFDLPSAEVLGPSGELMSAPLAHAYEAEGMLRVRARIAGETADDARVREDGAAQALRAREEELGLDHGALSREASALERSIAKLRVGEGEGDIAAQRAALAELEARRAPLDELAATLEAARKRRIAIEALETNARWRCRLHPDLDETGAELDLSYLEVGEYRITVTVQGETRHLSQAQVTVVVSGDEAD